MGDGARLFWHRGLVQVTDYVTGANLRIGSIAAHWARRDRGCSTPTTGPVCREWAIPSRANNGRRNLPRRCDARYCGAGFIPLASIILLASGERRKSRKAFAVSGSFAPGTKKAWMTVGGMMFGGSSP